MQTIFFPHSPPLPLSLLKPAHYIRTVELETYQGVRMYRRVARRGVGYDDGRCVMAEFAGRMSRVGDATLRPTSGQDQTLTLFGQASYTRMCEGIGMRDTRHHVIFVHCDLMKEVSLVWRNILGPVSFLVYSVAATVVRTTTPSEDDGYFMVSCVLNEHYQLRHLIRGVHASIRFDGAQDDEHVTGDPLVKRWILHMVERLPQLLDTLAKRGQVRSFH